MSTRKWTRALVKEGILARHKSGKDMSEKVSSEDDSSLVEAAKKLYRGWYAALDDVGIPSAKYRRVKSWDRESVISTLKDYLRQGKNIRPRALHKKHSGLLAAGERIFGSSREMYAAVGIDPAEIGLPLAWDKASVKSELRKRYESGADMSYGPVKRENPPLMAACENHFGTYYKSLEAAELPIEKIRLLLPKGHWTPNRITDEIRAMVLKGEELNDRHVNLRHGPLYGAAGRRFGSWQQAIEAAGIDYEAVRSQRKPYTEKELIGILTDLKEKGVPLDYTSVRSYYPRLTGGIIRVFGSYSRGIEAIGLDYDDIKRTWQFDKLKGEIFEDYVAQVLNIVGWKVEHHKPFKFANCKCIPDFYDPASDDWIDAKLKSWTPNVQAKVDKYLEHTDKVTLIFLHESRTKLEFWDPARVRLVPISRFYPELKKNGASRLIEDIELLRRGVIFKPEYQSRLRDFVAAKYPMKSREVMKVIEKMGAE